MGKPDIGTKRAHDQGTTADAAGAPAVDVMQQRVVAFAETLGRIAGTVQARAEGWMDREALLQQIASVRDGAAELLRQLAVAAAAPKPDNTAGADARAESQGRSGGVVDAPGKKHRKPAPSDPDGNVVNSQTANMRKAKTAAKPTRHGGRD